MRLEIFDVEHGQCSLLTSDGGAHMLIDAGHNSSTGWRPSAELRSRGIRVVDRLILTNCDEDHASDLPGVLDAAQVRIFRSNPTVSADALRSLKSSGGMGRGIEAMSSLLRSHVHPVTSRPDFGSLELQTFYNVYPGDFEDENNLSLLTILKWPEFCIAFTGDLEVAGWRKLIDRDEVRTALSEVDVFVASHHGRMNGYLPEIFTLSGMRPILVVVSDCGINYETQKTGPLYRKHASGLTLNGELRRVLTTRRDGTITFEITEAGATLKTSRSGPPLF